ncbi:MAG: transaldolase family protein [Candidatus Limnocylindrales bacterium]
MDTTTQGVRPPLADSPLGRTIAQTPTDIWNDSCALDELAYAISFGAVGATANPTIVADLWNADPTHWRARIQALAHRHPEANETALAWAVVEEMSLRAAPLLLPEFERSGGRQGRLSMQTDPTAFRSFDRMLDQGRRFDGLAPNIIVKFPATSVGIRVMEEATFHGVNVNATVSFSVAQAVAAGEAVERGLRRREAAGLSVEAMGAVITVMMGRLEDWLRVQAERDGIVVDPAALAWSGVAVFKRTVAEFRARGLRARPLGAAIRHQLHWSELIGGDVVITMPASWQRRFNASAIEVRPRMDDPVPPALVQMLLDNFPDMERALEPDGLTVAEFDTFGPTVRTLRAFIGSHHDLLHQVTDAMLPDPDRRTGS